MRGFMSVPSALLTNIPLTLATPGAVSARAENTTRSFETDVGTDVPALAGGGGTEVDDPAPGPAGGIEVDDVMLVGEGTEVDDPAPGGTGGTEVDDVVLVDGEGNGGRGSAPATPWMPAASSAPSRSTPSPRRR